MTANGAVVNHPAGLAFDSLAEQYDDIFTNSLIGRAQRQAVWAVIGRTFHAGDHILELNCGTGEDALFLARLGISVFACDASEKMVAVANRRHSIESPSLPARFEVLPIERIADASIFGPFNGVFSNFSGLNCVADISEVAQQLATLVHPGSPALLCMSGRLCGWETFWFLIRGEAGKSIRRWRGHAPGTLGRLTIEVQYPTIKSLRKLFSPYFNLRSWTGIGITVPPSYLEPFARRHARLLSNACAVDRVISAWPVLRCIGDHILLLFERTSS